MAVEPTFLVPVSDAEIQRERNKARELKKTPWWKRKKASGRCHYCGVTGRADAITMDHIVPVIRGGTSTKGNVVACCKACNSEKKHRLGFEWVPKGPELRAIEARMKAWQPTPIEGDPQRRAAVALILAPHEDGPQILLIRRAENPRDPWSGHMALPGGGVEETDAGLAATAARETAEEVGVDLESHGELITALNEVPAYSGGKPVGMVVSPFLFSLDRVRETRPDPGEVAAALWLPLAAFQLEENRTTTPIDTPGFKADMPAFVVNSNIVWGLTYRMIEDFLAAAAA
ncbi:MAG: NUDIX domain-containing protein [Deltaproteobacteria bacterium]